MKVDFNPTITNSQTTVKSRIKSFLTNGRVKLKTLLKDVFEKRSEKNVIVARKEPNWCQTDEDMPNKAVIELPISFEEFSEDCKTLGLNPEDFIIKHN